MSWQILEDSLIMAQSRGGLEQTIDNIRQGLMAIAADCPGYSASPVPANGGPSDQTEGEQDDEGGG